MDVFALSVSKVTTVEGAVHKLNIEPNAKFSMKVHQKLQTPPQCQYLHEKLQAMLDADIIEPCELGQVKCMSPTTLAQKTHEGARLMLESYDTTLTKSVSTMDWSCTSRYHQDHQPKMQRMTQEPTLMIQSGGSVRTFHRSIT